MYNCVVVLSTLRKTSWVCWDWRRHKRRGRKHSTDPHRRTSQ